MKRTAIYALPLTLLVLAGCKKESATAPKVTRTTVNQITQNTAQAGCTLSDDGGESVLAGGVCWGTQPKPTVAGSHAEGTLVGNGYVCTMGGLTAGTGYYVRGYATNGAGTGYSDEVFITTLAATLPALTTAYPKGVTTSTAQCGGEVTFDGGAPIARGTCWGTTESPTVADGKTVDGSGNGAFQSSLTGLSASTTYYARAYATSTVGTTYGAQVVIRTMQGTVTDIDGNTYQTVLIGTQEWMAENLKVTRYRNGDPIPNVTGDTQWASLTSGAYCSYENSSTNAAKYGYLYNFYAVADSRNLCPTGWHVPTDAEWTTLTDYLGGEAVAGAKMKSPQFWGSGFSGMDNSSGFTGLPSGWRAYDGRFSFQVVGTWWSSSLYYTGSPWFCEIFSTYSNLYRENNALKIDGFSIRCIKD